MLPEKSASEVNDTKATGLTQTLPPTPLSGIGSSLELKKVEDLQRLLLNKRATALQEGPTNLEESLRKTSAYKFLQPRTPEEQKAFEDKLSRRQEAENQAVIDRMKGDFNRSGVPLRHRTNIEKFNLTTSQEEILTDTCLEEVVDDGWTHAFIGKRGPGKTHVAACVVKKFCFRGRSALYTCAGDMFAVIRDSMRSEDGELAALRVYEKPNLLVIDESHVRGDTDYEDRVLTRLLDKRYGEMKCTLIISNLERESFTASIGSSIASRIQETGKIFVFDWDSFRSKKVQS